MFQAFRDRAEFVFVYIREAHPSDSGWPDPQTPIPDPRTQAERGQVATTCSRTLALSLPQIVDGLDDKVSLAYGAWPERIYVIGTDGRVAYRGGIGPFGFLPQEARRALAGLLDGK
jgi:hypothetical protein